MTAAMATAPLPKKISKVDTRISQTAYGKTALRGIRAKRRHDQITQLTANPAIRYWELVIRAQRPGIDFRTTFPLPIYKTS